MCFALPIFPFLPRGSVGAIKNAVSDSEKAQKCPKCLFSENTYINRKKRKWFEVAW
jgi:hypothetical protein